MREEINCYFKFIIPTFNNRPSIGQAKNSILNQDFDNLHVVVVHDGSSEYSFVPLYREQQHIENRCTDLHLYTRRYQGGARNVGIDYPRINSKYTMFLDDDDVLSQDFSLEELYNFIQLNNEPDMIRLPYQRHYVEENKTVTKYLRDDTSLVATCQSGKTAPWTKCVKSDLIEHFPENTTHEDVVQHIIQCDKCKTFAYFQNPVVVWNIYDKQTSKGSDPKWNSSKFRFIADLMDLKLNNSWAKQTRDFKVNSAIKALWNDYQPPKEMLIF